MKVQLNAAKRLLTVAKIEEADLQEVNAYLTKLFGEKVQRPGHADSHIMELPTGHHLEAKVSHNDRYLTVRMSVVPSGIAREASGLDGKSVVKAMRPALELLMHDFYKKKIEPLSQLRSKDKPIDEKKKAEQDRLLKVGEALKDLSRKVSGHM